MSDPTSDTLPPEPNQLIPDDYFCRMKKDDICPPDQALEIDLGCGDGSFLLDLADHHSDRHFLGVERLLGRVRKVCKRARKRNLQNIQVLRLETLYTVQWLLPKQSVSRAHLLCPDPWPKARHHKRRIMQAPFFKALTEILEPNGEFLFMTDDLDYFEWSKEHTAAFEGLTEIEWPDEAFFYPKTDFQRQWEAEGKSLYRMRFKLAEQAFS